MDFLEDLFEGIFGRHKRQNWGSGHHGRGGHHGRTEHSQPGYWRERQLTVCSQCGARNDATNAFCAACGTKLADYPKSRPTKTCLECDTENDPAHVFCVTCGMKLVEAGQLHCPACASPVPQEAWFCPNCGQVVSK